MVYTEAPIKRAVNLEDALTMIGYGRYHLFVVAMMGGCLMAAIVESQAMMFVIPAAQCDLNLDVTEKGVLSSVTFIGVCATSHFWGFIGDNRGRKKVILTSLTFGFITSFISTWAPYTWLFILMRLINGCFIGGCSAIVYAYAGEFHDIKHRSQVVSWITTFIGCGMIVLPGIAWLILPNTWRVDLSFIEFRPWRLLMLIYGCIGLFFLSLVWMLPESPKFLLAAGRHDEALEVLRKIYAINYRKNKEEFPVDMLYLTEENSNLVKDSTNTCETVWQQTVPLFKKGLRIRTLLLSILFFGIFMGAFGIMMWYPEILNEISLFVKNHPEESPTICGSINYYQLTSANATATASTVCSDSIDTSVYSTSMIIAAIMTVFFVFNGTVINSLGKKPLMFGYLCLGTVMAIASQLVSGITLIQVTLTGFILAGVSITVVTAFVVDAYPTKVRSMGLAITLMFGRIGAVAGTNIIGILIYNLCDYFLYIFAIIYILLAVIVIVLPSPSEQQQNSKPAL